jgi:hypothetical protein
MQPSLYIGWEIMLYMATPKGSWLKCVASGLRNPLQLAHADHGAPLSHYMLYIDLMHPMLVQELVQHSTHRALGFDMVP